MSKVTSIREEIRQNRPFGSRKQELLVTLLRTADTVRGYVGASLAAEGITLQQFNVLRILRGAKGEPIPTLEIADRMVEKTPGVTRLVDRLVDKELVDRQRCGKDRRRVLCTITDRGLALLDVVDPIVDGTHEVALADVSDDDIEACMGLLDHIRSNIRADEDA